MIGASVWKRLVLVVVGSVLMVSGCKREEAAGPTTAASGGGGTDIGAALREATTQMERLATERGTTFPVFVMPSKPVVKDGLSVMVTPAKASFAADGGPKFTVQFKNVTDKEFKLYDVDWFWKWDMRIEDLATKRVWGPHLLIMVKRTPQVRVCKPGETVEVVVDLGREMDFDFEWKGRPQTAIVPPIKHLVPGKYRMTVGITLEGDLGEDAASFWTGTIASEPVKFEITEKGAASQAGREKTNGKGWVLQVWTEKDQTWYALVPGRNWESAEAVSQAAVKRLEVVEKQMGELQEGESVFLMGHPARAPVPEAAANALIKYCNEMGLVVQMQK